MSIASFANIFSHFVGCLFVLFMVSFAVPKILSLIRIESPEISLCHLIYDKGSTNIQWRKDSLINKWCWENWTATCKRKKSEHSLTPYSKINSKWIKDLNGRPDTRKLSEKNIGRTLSDVNCSKVFSNLLPRLMKIKTKINKWDLIKLLNRVLSRESYEDTE